MSKLRLRDEDFTLIVDALDELRSHEAQKICADYCQQFGLEAMRLAETRAKHCEALIDRIRKARS